MESVYFKDQGEGEVLVLLHGFCETHEIWEEIIPELSNHFRVISPDLPGFGESAILSPPFSIKEVGQTIIDLLTSLEIKKCVIIGHSLGGYIALSMANQNPELMAGICLFHSTALPDSEEKKINRKRVVEFVRKNGVQPFIETFVPGLFFQKNTRHFEKAHKIASKTSLMALLGYSRAMWERPDMTAFLMAFEKPVLFLAGEMDTLLPVASLVDQAKTSILGEFKMLPEVGHMGMFEATAESIKNINCFSRVCFHSGTG